jgi:hypothetical protein
MVCEISIGGVYAIGKELLLGDIPSDGFEGYKGLLVDIQVRGAGGLGRGHKHFGVAAEDTVELNANKILFDPVLGWQPAGAGQQGDEQGNRKGDSYVVSGKRNMRFHAC